MPAAFDRLLDSSAGCKVLTFGSARIIVRHMNYSDSELSIIRTDEEALIEAGVQMLPVIARALFSSISGLGTAHGLTPAQVKVLLQLGRRQQMTVGEIATALDCSMPAASELVDRLVDAGHLVRASDPADRRRVLVAATPETRRISAHLCELRKAQVRYALDQLEPEERPIFVKSLEALIAGLAHAGDASLLDGCPGTPPASVDRSLANPVSAADPALAPQVREDRVTEEPIRTASLRGST
jgi:DNA-binding MarR family transcriptional regulator